METKLHVFDTYVSMFHPAHDIEKVHMNFCKRILSVKRSATNVVILSELGRTPLCIDRKIRILKYWLKLLKTKNCILKCSMKICFSVRMVVTGFARLKVYCCR